MTASSDLFEPDFSIICFNNEIQAGHLFDGHIFLSLFPLLYLLTLALTGSVSQVFSYVYQMVLLPDLLYPIFKRLTNFESKLESHLHSSSHTRILASRVT